MAFTTVPTLLSGQIPDSSEWADYKTALEELRPITAIKTSNQDKTNNTLADDPELTVALTVNTTFDILADLYISSNGNAQGDFSGALTFPAGCTLHLGTLGPANTLASGSISDVVAGLIGLGDTSSPSTTFAFGASTAGVCARVFGRIIVGSTAGNLTLQWAQEVTNANFTRFHAGSTLTIRKVA